MPSVTEVRDLMRDLTEDEWLQLLVECLGTYKFSREEASLIQEYGDAHLDKLQHVLQALN